MQYSWNWNIFWDMAVEGRPHYVLLLQGMLWTITTAACAWLLALAIGSVVGVLRTLPFKSARVVGATYVEFFRNIPLLMQVFIWFFVLPEVVSEPLGRQLKQLDDGPFLAAVLAIGFFMAARVAEQVRAGIQALPRGQLMAGTAMGLTRLQTYRYVLLPVAYRIILPPLTSDFMATVKNTSVAMTIGLLELTGRARAMQEFTFQVFEAFTAAALAYLILNLTVTALMRWLEKRLAIPGLIVVR
ncbi:amino acid ABC transporter permease [Variovorax sp. dw_954]|uniref:amino acid ABC transporter permease n=1 Tax=Variovorax sp. dw_954 TaxID=2720078 RepID=UPI001BD3B7B9|nr:amino acid ABC transporter permease [Variovorax sp. dw_954]